MKRKEIDVEDQFISSVSKLVIKLFRDIILYDNWDSDSEIFAKVSSAIRDILETEAFRSRSSIKEERKRKLAR